MRVIFAFVCVVVGACDTEPAPETPDGSSKEQRGRCKAKDASFWELLEIDGHWVEYHPTLQAMRDSADLAFLGRFTDVSSGLATHDQSGLLYAEAAFELVPDLLLVGDPSTTSVTMTLVIPDALSQSKYDDALRRLKTCLPGGPMLFFLRRRMSGEFTVVNGYGIWAATQRAKIDAPLNIDSVDLNIYTSEIINYDSVESLAEALRS